MSLLVENKQQLIIYKAKQNIESVLGELSQTINDLQVNYWIVLQSCQISNKDNNNQFFVHVSKRISK